MCIMHFGKYDNVSIYFCQILKYFFFLFHGEGVFVVLLLTVKIVDTIIKNIPLDKIVLSFKMN